ncbi:phage tail sheath family protein [Haliangium ochraceum]|uniref:Tail sheath protein n=1 Tax=Haliangium ochraceum (strain DSM 14365 / JCM 11303 / SMP-2) TaxID=502025 RepID=D0LXB9_HALO1|nr:phage tail sheath C-terminal domain-containing protein [Haliangium ochraceum]ACY16161.1 tail sheath protein [Haliangium ochraceum DSM 14365]
MRPSADLRPPGVYLAPAELKTTALEMADTRITGFIGLTEKGPVDEPQRIHNWDEFLETYGYTTDHYLSDTVDAYFRNGGTCCYIVRVAHLPREDGEERTLEHAASAECTIYDDWKKPALRVRALNEGTWGNNIWVKCVSSTGARALLTRDLEVGSGAAQVSSTRGFEVGALVRIYDRDSEDFVILTEVGDKLVRWSTDTPVNRHHRAAAPTQLEVIAFDLYVTLRERREVFKGLQMHPSSRNYGPRLVASRSRLVQLDDLFARSPPPHNMPLLDPMVRLEGGRDGTEHITPEDFIGNDFGPGQRSGLMALGAQEEVALLACPDAMKFVDDDRGPAGELRSQRVQDVMVDLCENLKDRFAVLDCPRTRDVEVVKRWRRRTDSSFCAYYWPWLEVTTSTGGGVRVLPPSGAMAGVYAQRDTEGGVHHAPANVAIVGAEDLSLRVIEDHLGALNAEGVNCFRMTRGVRPWGARTASSDPEWRYINVRRLFIMLRRSLDAGMRWVAFEPNNPQTWDVVQSQVGYFLEKLFEQGMFAGGKAEEAFYVKCDGETNPPDQVDNGFLVCEIGVAPVYPTEFMVIHISQSTGAG